LSLLHAGVWGLQPEGRAAAFARPGLYHRLLSECQVYQLPLIGLRGISDGVEALRDISDWTRCLPIIDRRLAGALDILFMALAEGRRLRRS
jgi:hypothetical protein